MKRQLFAACLGVQQRVEEIQGEASIKDKTAQRWIEILILKAREAQKSRIAVPSTRDVRLNARLNPEKRKELGAQIKVDIQQELMEWLYTQPKNSYDAIPLDSGENLEFSASNSCADVLEICHIELRRSLRPGDHYNALLELPGAS